MPVPPLIVSATFHCCTGVANGDTVIASFWVPPLYAKDVTPLKEMGVPPLSVNVPAPGPVPVRTRASFIPFCASSVM